MTEPMEIKIGTVKGWSSDKCFTVYNLKAKLIKKKISKENIYSEIVWVYFSLINLILSSFYIQGWMASVNIQYLFSLLWIVITQLVALVRVTRMMMRLFLTHKSRVLLHWIIILHILARRIFAKLIPHAFTFSRET